MMDFGDFLKNEEILTLLKNWAMWKLRNWAMRKLRPEHLADAEIEELRLRRCSTAKAASPSSHRIDVNLNCDII